MSSSWACNGTYRIELTPSAREVMASTRGSVSALMQSTLCRMRVHSAASP